MRPLDLNAYQSYFDASLAKALARYEERVGEVFPVPVALTCIDDNNFWAFAKSRLGQLELDVSTGVLERIHEVWKKALDLSADLPPEYQIELLGHQDHTTETSIQWLLQHELNHNAIGHFDLIQGGGLSEDKSPHGLGIVQRTNKAPSSLDGLSEKERTDLHLCFELQTDHDAIEIVLGAYHADNWPLFRYYAICILVVMFIIEGEEQNSTEPLRHHPHAETRLFQLIAHLVELPMIPGIKRAQAEDLDHLPASYLPSAEELIAYRTEVVGPVMTASHIIAEACDMTEAGDSLSAAEAMFADIDAVILHQTDNSEELKTKGAKQWAKLRATNANLLKKMGW